MPLKEVLKDVRVVGLGEATHGTREFFQFKHRMMEFLVKEMGFTVLAMEGSYAATAHVNNYVLYGKDRAKAIASLKAIWITDTAEILEMIEWMRAYNQTVPKEKKIKIFGFDPQFNDSAMQIVIAYLRKIAPDRGRTPKRFSGKYVWKTRKQSTLSRRKFQSLNFPNSTG